MFAAETADIGAPARRLALLALAGSAHCTVLQRPHRVQDVAFSPDGTILASGSWGNGIGLYNTQTQKEIGVLSAGAEDCWSVAFSPDGKTLASGSGGAVLLWDTQTQMLRAPLRKGGAVFAWSVAFAPDGRMLASGSAGTVQLWDTQTQQQIANLNAENGAINSVAFSPDGTMLASGSNGSAEYPIKGRPVTVCLWDPRTPQWLAALKEHDHCLVNTVAFSPDGKTLVSCSYDKTVRLWDTGVRRTVAVLRHTDGVGSVAFSPDGRTLASGSDDKTVQLWDMNKHKEVAVLQGHTAEVKSVAFSPDGRELASGSWDKTVRLWQIKP